MDRFKDFETMPTRKGSWSTNALQGYLHHRVRCIARLEEALEFFKGHLDCKAFEEINSACEYMKLMQESESYSNYAGSVLLDCADHIEAADKGLGVTHSYNIVEVARTVGMGGMPK